MALLLGPSSAQLHLPHIDPGKIAGTFGGVDPTKVAEALKHAKLPHKVQGLTPGKAVEALSSHPAAPSVAGALGVAASKSNVNVSHVVQAATQGLNKAKGATPGAVDPRTVGLEALRPETAIKVVQGAIPQSPLPKDVTEPAASVGATVINTVKNTDPGKVQEVQHALTKAGSMLAEAVQKTHNDQSTDKGIGTITKKRIQEAIHAMETPDWWGAHWPYISLVLVLLGSILAGFCYFRTAWSKGPRSPNLLVDAEINMWVRSSGGRRQVDAPEEPLFRQF